METRSLACGVGDTYVRLKGRSKMKALLPFNSRVGKKGLVKYQSSQRR